MIDAGEITLRDIEQDLRDCEKYNSAKASARQCIMHYRGLRESHTGGGASAGSSQYNYDKFARLCLEDDWTIAELDYAVGKWDRKDTAFPPTYGQLLALRTAGRADIVGPGRVRFVYYKKRVDELKKLLVDRPPVIEVLKE